MAAEEEKEVTPGTPEFDQMVFKMNNKMDEKDLSRYDYNGESFQKIQDDVYVMPAFIKDDFNLFFVAAPLVDNDWVICFSTAKIENSNEVTDLSDPMPTGKGLNQLGEKSPDDANHILKYFNTLVDAGYGEWKLVQ